MNWLVCANPVLVLPRNVTFPSWVGIRGAIIPVAEDVGKLEHLRVVINTVTSRGCAVIAQAENLIL